MFACMGFLAIGERILITDGVYLQTQQLLNAKYSIIHFSTLNAQYFEEKKSQK